MSIDQLIKCIHSVIGELLLCQKSSTKTIHHKRINFGTTPLLLPVTYVSLLSLFSSSPQFCRAIRQGILNLFSHYMDEETYDALGFGNTEKVHHEISWKY